MSLNVYNEMVSRLLVLGAGGVVAAPTADGRFGVVACYSLAESPIGHRGLCSREAAFRTVDDEGAVAKRPGYERSHLSCLGGDDSGASTRGSILYLVTLIKGTTAAAYYGSAYRVLGMVPALPALALAQIAIAHTVPRGTERLEPTPSG